MKFWTSGILILVLLATAFGAVSVQPAAQTIPTFDIVSVVKDTSVTIKTQNYPANRTFEVRMGKIGTRGVNGTLVGSFSSGGGGSLTQTFNIPEGLRGLSQISIRADATSGGWFSYNFFSNTTFGTPGATSTPGGPTPTRTATSTGPTPTRTATARATIVVPTFTIESVVKDSKVTIKTANFPANQQFEVRMGKMGTRGVNGVLVTTQSSGTGGTFTATYDVPASLKGERQIAIRLQSTSSGYFSYNWFWNSST